MTFFIALFVLLMQFIWLYIDDMLGKGLEWYVIAELLVFASANLVPLALPLSILLASIMTFGNLGEHFELVSFKAAGISLQKVMKPLIIMVVFISFGAFFFANNIIPVANLKFYSLLHDIRSQKPALNILPGVFYNEIDGYVIRVKEKEPREEGDLLKDVKIYNHIDNQGNRKVTVADSAIMKMSDDNEFFTITLYNGTDYQDQYESKRDKSYPFSRFNFEEHEMRIDMRGFKMDRTDEELFKEDYRMLNLEQLANKQDTLQRKFREKSEQIVESLTRRYYSESDTIRMKKGKKKPIVKNYKSFDELMASFNKKKKKQLYNMAVNNARVDKGKIAATSLEMEYQQEELLNIRVEWHRKFTFSLACLIMFFIGAPLGAIVRKGGLGMPVVISVIFFLLFWILSISGEKMAKELVLEPYQGMWLATTVLFPLGIFFTYKATTDSAMFNIDSYFGFFKKLFKKRDK